MTTLRLFDDDGKELAVFENPSLTPTVDPVGHLTSAIGQYLEAMGIECFTHKSHLSVDYAGRIIKIRLDDLDDLVEGHGAPDRSKRRGTTGMTAEDILISQGNLG